MCICLADGYALPQPGPSATRNPLNSRGQTVTLTMDTHYPDASSAYFQVCRYNSSFPDILVNCCSCYTDNCPFGEVFGNTEKNYLSCQLNTSYTGVYQFQIKITNHYPCFINIGNPIDVNDNNNDDSNNNFEFNFHILSYSLGGLCLLLVVGILGTFCITKRFYKRREQRYALIGMH